MECNLVNDTVNTSHKTMNSSPVPCVLQNLDNATFSNASFYQPYGVHILGYMGTGLGCMAVILNFLFLVCVCCTKDRDSAFNRFIQNLAICDILGSISFIVTQNWPQGPFAHIIENQHLSHVWKQVECLHVFIPS